MIVRDTEGDVLMSARLPYVGVIPVAQAEAKGICFGLRYAHDLGFRSSEV